MSREKGRELNPITEYRKKLPNNFYILEMSIPIRQCIGCMLRRPKEELVRIVFDRRSKKWIVDEKKRLPGRGFYMCENDSCFKLALKRRKRDFGIELKELLFRGRTKK